MWRTPATLRGSLDDVPAADPRAAVRDSRVILAIETSCDDTCAAVVTPRRADPLQRRLLAGRARPLRRRRARDRLAPPPRARQRGRRRRARHGRRVARRRRAASPSPRAPGLVGALLVGVATGKALAAARRLPARAGRPPAGPRRRQLPAHGGPPFEPPFLCLIASRRPHAARRASTTTRATRRSAARSTTRPARRSTRARGCSASATPAARRCPSSPPTGDPAAFDFPTGARVAGLDFSFAGLKTALLYKVRDLGEEAHARARRRPRRRLRARDRGGADGARASAPSSETGLDRVAIGGGVAANRRLRERVAALGVAVHVPPPAAVHRQRGDDRLRRALGDAAGLPRATSALDAYATRRARGGMSRASGPGSLEGGVRRRARRARAPACCWPAAADGAAAARSAAARSGPSAPRSPIRCPTTGARRRSPQGRRERVLVELPRPALGELDDVPT